MIPRAYDLRRLIAFSISTVAKTRDDHTEQQLNQCQGRGPEDGVEKGYIKNSDKP